MKKRSIRPKKANGISGLHSPHLNALEQKLTSKVPKASPQKPQQSETIVTITITPPKKDLARNSSLRSVHGTLTFKLRDGKELSNLIELAHALEEMADETFFHHANIERNDFSSWIKEVFDLDGLAKEIKEAWSTTGDWDCSLWVDVDNPAKVEKIVWGKIRANKWVDKTETHWSKKWW